MTRIFAACWLAFVVGIACLHAQVPMTGAGLGSPSAGYTGPGDLSLPSIKAWWGLQCYSAAYAGNVARIKSPSNVLTGTIGCDGAGNIVLKSGTAIGTVCAVSCTIDVLYDQSGANSCSAAACDLSQATENNRYLYHASCIGALPCLDNTSTVAGPGSAQMLNTTGMGSINQQYTVTLVKNNNVTAGAYDNFFSANAGAACVCTNNSGDVELMYVGLSLPTVNVSKNAYHVGSYIFNNASGSAVIDATTTTMNVGGTTAWPAGNIGLGYDNGRNTIQTQILTVGFWAAGFSAGNATTYCHNQFTYWGTSTSC